MTPKSSDFTRLLTVAIGLVHTPHSTLADTVRIGDAHYRVVADQVDGGNRIVVLMQEPRERRVCDDVLRSCYGLTERELQVAHLLAHRHSNREIAQILEVAQSTAGRHTERVLKKLEISSRRDVRQKLQQSAQLA